MHVNLLSDTVTKPSTAMLEAILMAEVGDDVFGKDPTANALEQYAARLFGMDAAVFCPSGTMTNQIAIQMHCDDLTELICDETSHVYQYETGGYAYNARAAVNLIKGNNGKINADQISDAIKPNRGWLPKTALVVIENTSNKGGGSYYRLEEIYPIRQLCDERGIGLHLDGARLFNALVETKEKPAQWGALFDSISICLSKGLGAPVGSLLLGKASFISQARRYRKVMGGGMRQSGFMAAAGLFALKNNIARLSEDHHRAKKIGAALSEKSFIKTINPVMTNIIIFELDESYDGDRFVEVLLQHDIAASAMGKYLIRMVTHLDLDDAMIDYTINVIQRLRPTDLK
ncbi:MAG: aminotransferase class I/II-fold pyridoxal phosphate-dependent enzyme [Saprospiraceae bacterium]|nr:aminotransferase class I/II-fold pyridoxal phosphate-dependent enzyme [Saprospiraceae bacterium]